MKLLSACVTHFDKSRENMWPVRLKGSVCPYSVFSLLSSNPMKRTEPTVRLVFGKQTGGNGAFGDCSQSNVRLSQNTVK